MALVYYLTIDGVVGDSLSDRNKGAFEVANYDFDVTAVISAVTGGGAGSSKPTFSPLTVELELGSGLTALLKDIATGKHIPSIELKGVFADGRTVYDLRLGDVVVTSYHDSNSGHDMLSFSYQQVSLTTWAQQADGSLGEPVSFSWNIATNSEDVDIPPPVANHAPTAHDDAATATGIGGTTSGNVLTNDSDTDGDPLTVTPFNGAGAYGNLTLNSDGSFSYVITNLTGATGSHLHDVFTYTETDGRGGNASAELDITLNRAPDVIDNVAGVKTGAASTGNVFSNDADRDGDQLSVTAVNGGSLGSTIAGTYGTLVLSADGSYTYTANPSIGKTAAPQDVFHFTESDGHGGLVQSSLTFSIISNGQNYIQGTPGQTVAAGNGKAILDGALGDQHLLGGNGADVLIGGAENVLTGGNGPDQFVFKSDFGSNHITDFARPDTILLEKATFGSISEILTLHASNDGHGNTIIADPHDSANFIILDHVSVSQLTASNFLLV
jgi:VCBS repeat-containing protein